jgi:uncharacterized glyoxalase superfamily protein PhnB
MFMLKDTYEEDIPALEGSNIAASATFYFDVDDVEALYSAYKQKGVEIVKDISTTWYRMREFYIRDCNGYILGFAEQAK